jgi:hypothetical protein
MAQLQTGTTNELVFLGDQSGLTVIPQPTVLTRLNYFDGKFLRATDLQREQEYLRMLVEVSNLGGGAGVVNGFSATLGSGDQINLSPGLAIDPAGRVLMLPTGTSFGIQDLIDASLRIKPVVLAGAAGSAAFAECAPVSVSAPGVVAAGQDFYLLTIGHAEALCGEEDVYGRLCEAACATSTDRPYRVEGVVVRATPFTPTTPLPVSTSIALDGTHLRSQLASACFADEALVVASLISKSGLALDTWCLGANLAGGQDVPIAVFVRSGTTTLFLDAWTARRERIEAPARRYWAWRMAMRPWDVYLAQILQFQCQLHDLILAAPAPGGPGDPCKTDIQLLGNTAQLLKDISDQYTAMVARLQPTAAVPQAAGSLLPGGIARLETIRVQLASSLQGLLSRPTNRILISGGIIELPSAGYLPVDVGSNLTVNDQVRQLLGDGLDLRFCVVRPDYVAHALEEAQHMERISLLVGLDHPEAKPKVDILVPDGQVVDPAGITPGTGLEGEIHLTPTTVGFTAAGPSATGTASLVFRGAGHNEVASGGGWAFEYAGSSEAPAILNVGNLGQGLAAFAAGQPAAVDILGKLAPTQLSNHAAILTDPGTIARARMLAVSATDFVSNPPTTEAAPAAAQPPVFGPRVQPGTKRPAALWLAFWIERNPLALQGGDTTAMSMRHIFVSPAVSAAVVDERIQGELTIVEVFASGGDIKVTGHLSGFQDTSTITGGTAGPPATTRLETDVTIYLTHPGAGPTVAVSAQLGGLSMTLRATSSGVPTSTQATLSAGFGSRIPFTIASAQMTVNSDVLTPGNSTHLLALSAVQVIGASINDATFAPTAIRQLFPAPPPFTGDQIVRPTRDWVLFQRRREALCAGPVTVAAPPRTYQLYSVVVKDPSMVTTFVKALKGNDATGINQFQPQSVDAPRFGGGVSALETPSASVHDDWLAHGPGNTLLYAAIADRNPDDPLLLRARLGTLEQVIASVSAPDPNLINDAISNIPTGLDVPGTDGIIVLVTSQVVQTTCHTVYRLNLNPETSKLLTAIGQPGVVAQLLKISTRIGDVDFTAGTPAIVPGADDIPTLWNAAGGAAPVGAFVVSSTAATDVASVTLRGQQAAAIMAELQAIGPAATIKDVPTGDALPSGDCSIIDLILPAVAHQVIAVKSRSSAYENAISIIKAGTFGQANIDAFLKQQAMADLGTVEFWGGTNMINHLTMKLADLVTKLKWQSAQVLSIVVLYDKASPPENPGSLVPQANLIAKALAATPQNPTTAVGQSNPLPNASQQQPPVGPSPVLTIFVIESS